jgi:drug/metabolite transporter (DMT)-like permease
MAAHVLGAAGTYLVGKAATTGFGVEGAPGFGGPAALTLLRSLLASALCLALTGWAVPAPRFTARQWLEIAGLGVLLVPMNQYLFLRGLGDTVPWHAGLIYALTPAGVVLLTAALDRRRPPAAWAFGILAALAGVVLVLEPWRRGQEARDIVRGDLTIGVGLLVWVVYTVWMRRLARRSDPRTVTVWTLVLGTAFLAPFAGPSLAAVDFGRVPLTAWVGLGWLAVVTSTLMMLLWNSMLRTLEPAQVAICANAQPAATAALAIPLAATGFLEHAEPIRPAYWAGTALVVAGVATVQLRGPGSGRKAR